MNNGITLRWLVLAAVAAAASGLHGAKPIGFDANGHPMYRVGGAKQAQAQPQQEQRAGGGSDAARRRLVRVALESWTLNANDGVAKLTFNAGMKIDTLNASAVILQQNQSIAGNPAGSQSFRLCICTSSSSVNGPEVSLGFNRTDKLQMQALDRLAIDRDSTYLIYEPGFMQTLAGGYPDGLLDGAALKAAVYIKDYTRPVLWSFDLDLKGAVFGALNARAAVGYLTLRFSEVMDVSTLRTAAITLRQTANYTANVTVAGHPDGQSYALTSATFASDARDSDVLVLTLGAADLNAIKLLRGLAIDRNSTALVLNYTAVADMKGLPVQAITKESNHDSYAGRGWMAAMVCAHYIADNTAPSLVFFMLDNNVGLIRLTFDEAVVVSTLDVTQIAIQTSVNGARRLGEEGEEVEEVEGGGGGGGGGRRRLSSRTLTGGAGGSRPATGSVDGPSLIIKLGTADLNAVKAASTTKGSSFITLGAGAIQDSSYPQNRMTAVPAGAAFGANRFIVVGMTGYTLDINGAPNFATLTIAFNGNVNPTTFDATKLTFQHAKAAGINNENNANVGACSGIAGDCGRYTLTAASSKTVQAALTNSLVVTIDEVDLNQLKLRQLTAISKETTWLSVDSSVIKDANGDEVTPYLDGDVLYPPEKVGTFTQDKVQPTLQSYDLDMHTGTMTLHFSEVMNASSLNVTKLVLQNNRIQSDGIWYALSDSTVTSANAASVSVRLSRRDLNALKTIKKLAIDQAHTYLLLYDPAIRDMAGNMVVAIPNGGAQLVATFTADTGSPTLTGGIAGVRPVATSFFADFERGVLILTFSEPVDVTTFDPTGVVLMNSTYGNASEYRLTRTSFAIMTDPLSTVAVLQKTAVKMELAYVLSGKDRTYYDELFADDVAYNAQSLSLQLVVADPIKNVVDQKLHAMTSHIIAVQLSTPDLEAMAIMPKFATSMDNTFLKMETKALKDMAGNPIEPILPMAQPGVAAVAGSSSSAGALTPAFFNADTGRPTLDRYELDMGTCVMKLTFSEAMSWKSIDLPKYTLLPNAGANQTTRGSSTYTPLIGAHRLTNTGTSPSLVQNKDGKVILVTFGAVDCNSIRRVRSLAKSKASTWMIVDSGGAKDMSGLDMLPILSGAVVGYSPLNAWKYTADTTPPQLVEVKMDLANNRLRLKFSEIVDMTRFDITKMALQQYKKRSADPDFVTNPAHTQVAFTTSSFAYDLLDDPSYCPSLEPTVFNGKKVYARIVENGMVCAMAIGPNGVDVVMFSRGVDIAVNISASDQARIIAAWPVGTKAEDIKQANGNVFLTATGQLVSDFSIPDPNQSSHKVVVKVKFLGASWTPATFTEAVQLQVRNSYARFAGVDVAQVIILNIVFATSRRLGGSEEEEGHSEGARRRLAVGDVTFEIHIFVFSASSSSALRSNMALVTDAAVKAELTARVTNAITLSLIPASIAAAVNTAVGAMSITSEAPVAIVIAGNAMSGVTEELAMGVKTVTCSSCAGVGWESRKCSFLDDRVCTACTLCPYDHWTIAPCTISTPGVAGQDTVCHRCSSCTAGKFVRRPCGGGVEAVEGTMTLWTGYSVAGNKVGVPTAQGADTYCRRCRTCEANTFETRPCEMGLDRQCQVRILRFASRGCRRLLLLPFFLSCYDFPAPHLTHNTSLITPLPVCAPQTCDSCTLSLAQERLCAHASVVWRRVNCCWDTDNTHVKPCHDIPLEQFKISARDSHRDEVWCRKFDREKKQCMDTMYQNGEEPLGGHIDETEHFDGTTSRYKSVALQNGKEGRIWITDTNIPVQSYGDAADTNRVIPATAATHESNVHPGTHPTQYTGTQNPTTQFGLEHIHSPPIHNTGN